VVERKTKVNLLSFIFSGCDILPVFCIQRYRLKMLSMLPNMSKVKDPACPKCREGDVQVIKGVLYGRAYNTRRVLTLLWGH
jgi:hypothetical protein